MMVRIETDFHIHSFYSDGTFFPRQILKLVKEKNLKYFSITDHNCVACDIKDPRFISGIEISVEDNLLGFPIKGLEILGYGFNVEDMKEKIEPLRKEKMDDLLRSIANFNKFNFDSNIFALKKEKEVNIKDFFEFRLQKQLTNLEVERLLEKCSPSKIDFAEFLLKNCFIFQPGLEKTYGNLPFLFKNEFAGSIFNNNSNKLTFKQAIEMIKECEGTSVLAHPGICKSLSKNWFSGNKKKLAPLDFLETLKNWGLDGVEMYNYSGVMKFSKESEKSINKYFYNLSKKIGLLNTYGSDCHGEKWWGFQLGKFGSSVGNVKDFLSKVV